MSRLGADVVLDRHGRSCEWSRILALCNATVDVFSAGKRIFGKNLVIGVERGIFTVNACKEFSDRVDGAGFAGSDLPGAFGEVVLWFNPVHPAR